jgi:hypothetical protein
MSERITINLTEPKEEITFTLTDQKEEVVFSFSEAARGPQGEPGESASVTNANVNTAIESNPSATRDSLDLGTAALADTGTGASNVILGNDARLTDARTPTAHASSHVTGGTDKIRDASAAQDGLMTTTFAAKLDGIEAGADVTDSTNVNAAGAVMESDYTPSHSLLVQQSGTGSPSSLSIGNNTLVGRLSGGGSDIDDLSASQVRTLLNVEDGADVTDAQNVASTITGATAKTTLVDADETVLTDSAAAFGLKKVTFANLWVWVKSKIDGNLTIAGTKTWSGLQRATGQNIIPATGDELINSASNSRVASLYPNATLLPAMSGYTANTGTTSGVSLGFWRAGDARLRCGDSNGGYAASMFIRNFSGRGVNRINFDSSFRISGSMTAGLADSSVSIIRLLIGHSNASSIPPLADASPFADKGIGLEIAVSGTTRRVRGIYHDGTTNKQTAWETIGTSVLTASIFAFEISNNTAGNFTIKFTNSNNAVAHVPLQNMIGVADLFTITDGATGSSNSTNNTAVLAAISQPAASFSSGELTFFDPIYLVTR